jgi:hypothetical protein
MDMSADDLAGIRDTIAEFLPDPVTNSRTGATLNIRLDDGTREYRPYAGQRLFLLRSRELVTSFTADIAPGDILSGASSWLVLERIEAPSFDLDVRAMALELPTPVICSTQRQPQFTAIGAAADYTTSIASLACYPFFGTLLQAVSPQFMADTFGVSVQQPHVVIAQKPATGEIVPIVPGDFLVTTSGSFIVQQVGPFAPGLVSIYVDVPRS